MFYEDSEDEEIIMKKPVQAQLSLKKMRMTVVAISVLQMRKMLSIFRAAMPNGALSVQQDGLKLVAHVLSAVSPLTKLSEYSLEMT